MTTEKISRQCMHEEMRLHDVHVFEPKSKKEKVMAEGLEVFSSFVLDEEKELTLTILEKHLGRSVGLLQGGTEEDKIYRVTITSDDDKDNASEKKLLKASRCSAHLTS